MATVIRVAFWPVAFCIVVLDLPSLADFDLLFLAVLAGLGFWAMNGHLTESGSARSARAECSRREHFHLVILFEPEPARLTLGRCLARLRRPLNGPRHE